MIGDFETVLFSDVLRRTSEKRAQQYGDREIAEIELKLTKSCTTGTKLKILKGRRKKERKIRIKVLNRAMNREKKNEWGRGYNIQNVEKGRSRKN